MPDKYEAAEAEKVNLLVRRAYKEVLRRGLTYRQLKPLMKADPGTIHSWFHGKHRPSRRHVVQLKAFMGYITA